MHDSASVLANGLPPTPARIEAGGPGVALGVWSERSEAAVLWLYRRRNGDFMTYLTMLLHDGIRWREQSESGSGSGSFPCVDDASGEWNRHVAEHRDYWALEAETATDWGEEQDGTYPDRLRVLALCAAQGVDAVRIRPPDGEDYVVTCDPVTGVFMFGYRGEGPAHLTVEAGDAKRWLGTDPVPWW